jgi:hypothetical protein
MALALNNAQGELSPLEVGLHALHSGKKVAAYAREVGMPDQTLRDRVKAAEVYEITDIRDFDPDCWQSLAAIHAVGEKSRWLWPALVAALVADVTKYFVAEEWMNLSAIRRATKVAALSDEAKEAARDPQMRGIAQADRAGEEPT